MKKLLILSFLAFSFSVGFAQRTLFRYYNGKIKKHYYTTDFTEYGKGRNGWAFEGPACLVYTAADRQRGIIPFFRYLNSATGDHYYTTHFEEFGQGGNGYHLEGPACYIGKFPAPGTVPLFKYFNHFTNDHFYTINKSELGRHGFEGYEFKGIEGFVFPR